MTETMVERVARRIYERRNGAGCKPWSRLSVAHYAPYLDDARAAIEAMREPTPTMLHAAKQTWWPDGTIVYDYGLDDEDMAKAFNAMIDAALAETEGG